MTATVLPPRWDESVRERAREVCNRVGGDHFHLRLRDNGSPHSCPDCEVILDALLDRDRAAMTVLAMLLESAGGSLSIEPAAARRVSLDEKEVAITVTDLPNGGKLYRLHRITPFDLEAAAKTCGPDCRNPRCPFCGGAGQPERGCPDCGSADVHSIGPFEYGSGVVAPDGVEERLIGSFARCDRCGQKWEDGR